MDMSDSPLFSSGDTGPSAIELFGPPPGAGSNGYTGRSSERAYWPSQMSTNMSEEYVMLNHRHMDDNIQTATQEIQDMDLSDSEDESAKPPAYSWGSLISMNPSYNSVHLVKEDRPGSGGGYLLGRHKDCDIRFDSQLISNRHCLIYKVEERVYRDTTEHLRVRVYLEDLSSNGTFINGEKVGRGVRRELEHGDEIQLAIWNQHIGTDYFFDRFYIFQHPDGGQAAFLPAENANENAYRLEVPLGKGNFAVVWRASRLDTNEKIAIKVMKKKDIGVRPKFLDNLRREISIMMQVNHPAIVSIYGVRTDYKNVYVLLELLHGGELFDRIVETKGFTEDESRIIFLQLFHAIKYLHSRGISHRDLKPENILLVDDKSLRLKISDFGLSRIVNDTSFLHTLCGTPGYVAPEVITSGSARKYTKAVDMWSLGVILYICLCGFPPFSDQLAPPSLKQQIREARYSFPSPYWDRISPEAKDLVQSLLTVHPDDRITVNEAIAHPWMQKIDLSVGGLDETFLSVVRDDIMNTTASNFDNSMTQHAESANSLHSLRSRLSQLNAGPSFESFAHVDPQLCAGNNGMMNESSKRDIDCRSQPNSQEAAMGSHSIVKRARYARAQ